MATPRQWPGEFYEGSSVLLMARVVGIDQNVLTGSDFPSDTITLNIYDVTSGLETLCHTQVEDPLDFVGSDSLSTLRIVPPTTTLNTGYGWPDSTGFNLAILVPGTWSAVQPIGGKLYRAELELTPSNDTDSGTIYVVWKLRCQPVIS